MNQTIQAVFENGMLRPMTLLFNLQEGQRALVTVQPIEELDPDEIASREAEVLRRMEAEGMIERLSAPDEPSPKDWAPLPVEGEPISRTIIKLRGEV